MEFEIFREKQKENKLFLFKYLKICQKIEYNLKIAIFFVYLHIMFNL